ncbi:hypothetical protein EZS27_039079, partial [termite gut metagenome]
LVAHAVVCNKDIDLDLAKCIVSRTVKIRKKQITIEAIQNVVSPFFSIDADLIHSLSRKRVIVQGIPPCKASIPSIPTRISGRQKF